MTKDPVCGMSVDEKKAAGTALYEGRTYQLLRRGVQDQVRKGT